MNTVPFSDILVKRFPEGKKTPPPWILSTDATATTGAFSLFDDPDHEDQSILVGADHPIKSPVRIVEDSDGRTDVLMTAEGLINGLDAIPLLKKTGTVIAASQVSILVLTPLIPDSFNYCLMTYPVGKKFDSSNLYELYMDVCKAADKMCIKIVSIIGDGDPRLRKLQQAMYNYIKDGLQWLTKIEFPFRHGLGVDRKCDFPMQDMLHAVKKLRNNCKYLTTRVLMLCDPAKITGENRLKFSATWETVVRLWNDCAQFKAATSMSAVALADKMDPSAVTDIMYCYSLFYENGYDGMGLLLEMITMMFASLYDKSLTPAARTILVLWSECLGKLRVKGKHFITYQTFQDVICTCEGVILYLLNVVENFKNSPIVPWFATSDHCEQLFSFLRISRYQGRKTNISAKDSIEGMTAANKSVILDGEGLHLLEDEHAHTRGRTLIPSPFKTEIYYGKDTSVAQIKIAIKQGADAGVSKFMRHSSFDNLTQSARDDLPESSESDASSESGVSSDSDVETIEDARSKACEHPLAKRQRLLNGGTARMYAQTRFKRVKSNTSMRLSLSNKCKEDNDDCDVVRLNDNGHFVARKKTKKTKNAQQTQNIHGKVLFMSVLASSIERSADRSSVSFRPVDEICFSHGSGYCWVFSNGKMHLCDAH